jgi:hypothetical protein
MPLVVFKPRNSVAYQVLYGFLKSFAFDNKTSPL